MLKQTFDALVDALVPADCPQKDFPELSAAARRLVAQRVAGLALPMRLVVQMIALLFGAVGFVQCGAPLQKVSLEARRRFIAEAENWPLVPFRELVRLARSLTLMATYDHPLTKNRMGFQPGGNGLMAA